MAIPVKSLRSPALRAKMQRTNWHPTNACELCQKPLRDPDNSPSVAIDHENYEFVTETEAEERGDAVSLFYVGPDCARKIKHALAKPPTPAPEAALPAGLVDGDRADEAQAQGAQNRAYWDRRP